MSASPITLQTVRDLTPLIQKHSAGAEAARKMAPEVMEALVDAGILRMWIPQAFGGSEMDPNAAMDIMEAFAGVDPAAGWIVSNCVFISIVGQFLEAPVIEQILGNPKAVTCGTFVPPGAARAVADGYSITGNWSFGSACHYATSLVMLTLLTNDDGSLVMRDGGPVSVVAFASAKDATIHDTWHVLGLRGTGSNNFSFDAHQIPANQTYILGAWEPRLPAFSGPLYRMGVWVDTLRIARVGVGIAQGALDDFIELALAKTPAYTTTLTADRSTVQERVAKAQALIEAGRNTLRAETAKSWEAVQTGPRISGKSGISLGLAATFALDAAVQAVDLLYESAGTTAFRDSSPLQKRFRDLQTLRQNAITSWSRYESFGKMILGRESDWAFHSL